MSDDTKRKMVTLSMEHFEYYFEKAEERNISVNDLLNIVVAEFVINDGREVVAPQHPGHRNRRL